MPLYRATRGTNTRLVHGDDHVSWLHWALCKEPVGGDPSCGKVLYCFEHITAAKCIPCLQTPSGPTSELWFFAFRMLLPLLPCPDMHQSQSKMTRAQPQPCLQHWEQAPRGLQGSAMMRTWPQPARLCAPLAIGGVPWDPPRSHAVPAPPGAASKAPVFSYLQV